MRNGVRGIEYQENVRIGYETGNGVLGTEELGMGYGVCGTSK